MINKVIQKRYVVTDMIEEGGISRVYLAYDSMDKKEVVLRTLKKESISSRIEDIIRFRNEAAILSRLNHPNIVKIYETGEYEGENYIIMEYVPGKSLGKLLQSESKFKESEIIEIALQVCRALEYIHPLNIVHRDLKPGNIMVRDHNHVTIIDFGMALVKEFASIKEHEEIAGTFSYMSPEHFGVTRRSVDERSDLYSLGVILYQLFTGVLPFEGTSISSIIHQQIAMLPVPPSTYSTAIPEILESIILKLLEKEPDNRYLSAKGLMDDLEKYQKGMRNFPLGMNDKQIRLSFKTGLISRKAELKNLTSLYGKALENRGNVCLISGETGKGKTRLVEELRSFVYSVGGLFIYGKCFSGQSKTPYGVIKDALNIYLKIYQNYTEEKKLGIKKKLVEMTGNLSGIILQLNSSFSIIFDNSQDIIRLEAEREKKRFLMVTSQFILNLSTVENGLVLLLDDLQWVDDGSMDLLSELSGEMDQHPLFVIGTYRNDEVNDSHRISLYRKEELESKRLFTEIFLDDLDKSATESFVRSLLYAKEENIDEISGIIYQKSKGNPFFAIEILKQFVNEKVIYYKEKRWEIDQEVLDQTSVASTIVDIVMKRISLLRERESRVLSFAAVIGRKFDVEILFRLLDYEAPEIIEIVDRAIHLQLLEEDLQEKGKILFAHDRIKEAFYKKCGEEEKKALHMQIGMMLESMHPDEKDKIVFDLIYHFIEGNNDAKILEYGYPAGLKAKENFAYEEALRYFLQVNTLTEKRIEAVRELWIDTNKNISEIYLIIGKNDAAIEINNRLLPFISGKLDIADVYRKTSEAYFKKGDWKNCEKYGGIGLSILGEKLPIGNAFVIHRILKEWLMHTLHDLFPALFFRKKRNPEEDRYKLIIGFYKSLTWMYYLTDVLKSVSTTLRALNLSESRIGNSSELGICMGGFASLFMAIPMFNQAIKLHEKALEYRKELNDTWGYAQSLQWLGYCYEWKGEFETSNRFLEESAAIFKRIGDLWELNMVYSGLSFNHIFRFDSSKGLEYAQSNYNICKQLNDSYGKCSNMYLFSMIDYIKGDYQSAVEDFEGVWKIIEQNSFDNVNCVVNTNLGKIYQEMKNYDKSIACLNEARDIYERNHFIKFHTIYVYSSLADTLIEKYKKDWSQNPVFKKADMKKNRIEIKKIVKKSLQKTKSWQVHYAEALRVSGKYYALAGKKKKSEKLFLHSLQVADRLGQKYESGKSHYEYALVLKNSGKFGEAKKNLESAYIVFKEIGSLDYLKRVSDILGISDDGKEETADSIQHLKNRERLSSIIKVTQTISSILHLDQLLNNIVSLAMETIGARRGYLFIKNEETGALELRVKSDIQNDKERNRDQFSLNIVEKVFNTGEVILSANAGKDEKYSEFNSVIQYELKSILCIPIKRHDKIIGVCYFDNPLSVSIFSSEDVEILEAIMAQAAISIENARLYERTNAIKSRVENEVEKLTVHISQRQEKPLDSKSTLVFRSHEMQEVVEKVNQAVLISRPVLITGETGTGKELIAKLIHQTGKNKNEPFIAVNCAAIPHTLWESELFGHIKGAFTDAKSNREGLASSAGKGTLFFDEIGEMPLEIQSKMLRLLQENQYTPIGSSKMLSSECRFVFAANKDIRKMIGEGTFREDLYYRISVFSIHLPPLRERKKDIPVLLDHFIRKYNKEFNLVETVRMEKGVMEKLCGYEWPGNIREMENLVIRTLAIVSSRKEKDTDIVKLADLPPGLFADVKPEKEALEKSRPLPENTVYQEETFDGSLDELLNRFTKKIILAALKKVGGNRTMAAKLLGIKRTTLYYKMKEFDIE